MDINEPGIFFENLGVMAMMNNDADNTYNGIPPIHGIEMTEINHPFADKVSGDFLSAKVESEDISYLCSEDGNGNTTGKADNDGIGNEFDDSSQFKHS